MGKKWPVPMNLPFFAVETYVPGGGSRIRPEKLKECLPAGTGTKIDFSNLNLWRIRLEIATGISMIRTAATSNR